MIRLATMKDAEAIKECAHRAYAQYVPRIGQKPAPMIADFDAQIALEAVHVACDRQGTFQGFIVFFKQDQHIMLENVAVLPEAAGKGIGKSLIQFCENQGHLRGFNLVRLYTNEKMTENLSIYAQLGYAEVERRTENGFNRVYFEKKLS